MRRRRDDAPSSEQPLNSGPTWSFADAIHTGIGGPHESIGDSGAAVATATRSSGAPLPDPLRRKFETSLGVNLESVRVHTGDASAHAAGAVAARAYAIGDDVHFGAGQYDPTSAAGEHLIAHEVAHTVQQRGGAAHTQHKLEVTGPGDACEVEADAAADAMVVGRGFALGGHGSAIARDPVLTPDQDAALVLVESQGVRLGARDQAAIVHLAQVLEAAACAQHGPTRSRLYRALVTLYHAMEANLRRRFDADEDLGQGPLAGLAIDIAPFGAIDAWTTETGAPAVAHRRPAPRAPAHAGPAPAPTAASSPAPAAAPATDPEHVYTQLHDILARLRMYANNAQGRHRGLVNVRRDGSVSSFLFGGASELLGGAGDLPGTEIWSPVFESITNAGIALAQYHTTHEAHPLERVRVHLAEAQRRYEECSERIERYQRRVEQGADLGQQMLVGVVAACAAGLTVVAAGLAIAALTPGAVAATVAGTAVPASTAGTGMTMLAGAAGTGVGSGTSSLVFGGARRAASDEAFDVNDWLTEASETAATNLISALVGGVLSRAFASVFTRVVVARMPPEALASLARTLGTSSALSPRVADALVSRARQRIIDFIAGIGGQFVDVAVRRAIAGSHGHTSNDTFMHEVANNLTSAEGLIGLFQNAVISSLEHRAETRAATPSGPSVPTESEAPTLPGRAPRPAEPATPTSRRTLTPNEFPETAADAAAPGRTTRVPEPALPARLSEDEDVWDGPSPRTNRTALPPPTHEITPEQAMALVPGVNQLTMAAATPTGEPRLVNGVPERVPLPWDHVADGCQDRAYVVHQWLLQQGIESRPLFVVSGRGLHVQTNRAADANFGPHPATQVWGWHVAAMVQVATPSGPQQWVFDPALDRSRPLVWHDWVQRTTTQNYQVMTMEQIRAAGSAPIHDRAVVIPGDPSRHYASPIDPNWGVPVSEQNPLDRHEANRPRITGYADTVPAVRLADALRPELANPARILEILHQTPPETRRRFAQAYQTYLRRDIIARCPEAEALLPLQ